MISVDDKLIKQVKKRLGEFEYEAPKVLYRALNRAASKAKTEIAKKTKDEYHIKSKEIKSTMNVDKAYKNNLNASITSTGPLMPLDKFKYKPKNPRPHNPPDALQVAVKKGGYKDLRHAFVADIHGNKIFQRVAKSRLPIKRLMGPAIPQMIDNDNVRENAIGEASATFEKRLDHEIKRVLERGKQ